MQKIKQFFKKEEGKDILLFVVIILVAFGSFYLGRLSKKQEGSQLGFEYSSLEANSLKSATENKSELEIKPKTQNIQNFLISNQELNKENVVIDKPYFASVRGKKYYPIDCSSGKSIKLENRKYFKNQEEAEKVGYEKSTSCKY